MKRIAVTLCGLVVLIMLALLQVEIRSDADAIFAPDVSALNTLDTATGRDLVVALASPDRATRNELARNITAMLADDPAVAQVNSGAVTPSAQFRDWIWLHRFRLAPPQPDDLTVAALTDRLAVARASLGGGAGFVLGDGLLRDPTGSFARLTEKFANVAPDLPQVDGIRQSRDDRAALIFVTLADRPFDLAETVALAARIRGLAAAGGVTVYLLGPRLISADISAETARESTRTAVLAGALLLLWLVWTLRSATALFLTLVPLASALTAACLVVQLVFGSVHVIALGFGGVLTGLALDYALHLLGHPGTARPAAQRLVLLGALTTAAGFLALLGAGVPALMQTGVFVATGLLAAAVVGRIIPAIPLGALRAPPFEKLAWHMPLRAWIETVAAVLGLAVIAFGPADRATQLFDPPAQVREAMAQVGEMVELPSGRFAIAVEAGNLSDLLDRQVELQAVLDGAVQAGRIGRYTMLAQVLPAVAAQPEPFGNLLPADVFAQRTEQALRANGMAPAFAEAQTVAYRTALAAPVVRLDEITEFAEMQPLLAWLDITPQGVGETVRLFGITDAPALAAAIAARDIPGVTMVDLAAPVADALAELRRQVLVWLGVGLLAALGVLIVGHADRRRALAIARSSAAAVGATAILLTLFTGALGVFEIVALTLLFGIGIDYGLFLDRPGDAAARVEDFRSVGLCAVSTLVAFSIMALSSVTLLHEIGLTVFMGVCIMVLFHFSRSCRKLGT